MLALVLALSITPCVFAEEPVAGTGKTIYVDAINGNDAQDGVGTTSATAYKTVAAAVAAANSGDTIQLGEGNYTLYNTTMDDTPIKEYTKNKDLTFVGQGFDKTGWNIGAEVPDPNLFGTEYNGDYSFDGAGTITFKNMTLRSGSADYLGFIRADNTIVEDCVINGKTFYWGYQTATFRKTTFNCPSGDYAIWTYCSPVMTFDNCTFNSTGKVINVYTDYSADKFDIEVNFNGCTVNDSAPSPKKQVLNINDSNRENYKYVINISGNNVINGVINADEKTCSRLFGYGGKANTNNTGRTIVNFGKTTVWQGGQMVNEDAYHNSGVTADGVTYANGVKDSNGSLYAEGYKDNAFDTTPGEWTTNPDGTITRTVTKTCRYCKHQDKVTEYQGKLTYDANGGAGTIDPATGAAGESVLVAENGFTLNNYTFTGWNTQADGKGTAYEPGASFTLTAENTVLYAQWSKNAPAQVNVSYDANGGVGTMESVTGDVGSEIVIQQSGFTRSEYTFTGWNTQADGKGTAYKAGDSFTLTDIDTVLYAQWSKNAPAQVKVSYNANGGVGTMESVTGDVGSKIVIRQSGFTRSEYTFTGWNTQADGKGTAYKAGDSFTLTDKDTVLYAQWSKNSGSAGTGTNGTAKPTDIPKTGDNSNLTLWFALLIVSGGAVIATAVISSKKKRSEK